MAVVYATLIVKGKKTLDQVPALIKPQVEEILKDLGIEGEYEGIGHCVLGYVDGEYPATHPRKDNWVYYVK